jgi:hypothetical protein
MKWFFHPNPDFEIVTAFPTCDYEHPKGVWQSGLHRVWVQPIIERPSIFGYD